MSDLACYRLNGGYAIRIYGGEYWLDADEIVELMGLIRAVEEGDSEALGEGYKELEEDRLQRAKQPKGNLLARLGLTSSPSVKRRTF